MATTLTNCPNCGQTVRSTEPPDPEHLPLCANCQRVEDGKPVPTLIENLLGKDGLANLLDKHEGDIDRAVEEARSIYRGSGVGSLTWAQVDAFGDDVRAALLKRTERVGPVETVPEDDQGNPDPYHLSPHYAANEEEETTVDDGDFEIVAPEGSVPSTPNRTRRH